MADGLLENGVAREITVKEIYEDGKLFFDIRCKYNPSNKHSFACFLYAERADNKKTLVASQSFEPVEFYGSSTFVKKIPNVSDDGIDLLENYGNLEQMYPSIKFTFVVRTYRTVGVPGEDSSVSAECYIYKTEYTAPEADMELFPVCKMGDFYLQGHSSVNAVFSNPREKYGSSAARYGLSVEGQIYDSGGSDSVESAPIASFGTVRVVGTVYGEFSRNRHYVQKIQVIPYASPLVVPVSGEEKIIAARCDEDGEITEGGEYLLIKAGRQYCSIMHNDHEYNSCSLWFRYKSNEEGDEYSGWEELLSADSNSDEVITEPLLGDLSPSMSYTVQIKAVDATGSSGISTVTVPTDIVYMHRAGSRRSLGIGKYVENDNSVDIAEDLTLIVRGKTWYPKSVWKRLGLDPSNEADEANEALAGACGYGCFYKVSPSSNHVYVLFNGAFSPTGTYKINKDPIPEEYRPARAVYSVCAAECSTMIALAWVDTDGDVYATVREDNSDNTAIEWINGQIDYPLDI